MDKNVKTDEFAICRIIRSQDGLIAFMPMNEDIFKTSILKQLFDELQKNQIESAAKVISGCETMLQTLAGLKEELEQNKEMNIQKDKAIIDLHSRLNKENRQEQQRFMVEDLLTFYDDIEAAKNDTISYCKKNLELKSSNNIPLINFVKNFDSILNSLEKHIFELLKYYDVKPIPQHETYNRSYDEQVSEGTATKQEENDMIQEIEKTGFMQGERVIRKNKVCVRKFHIQL